MKATLPTNPAYMGNLHNYRKESSFWKQISAIDPKTGRELVIARFYGAGSVVYCCLWIHPEKKIHGMSGAYKAGGYGYHKASAALGGAIDRCGIKLSDAIDGRGDSAMVNAIEAIALKCTNGRKVYIVEAHA